MEYVVENNLSGLKREDFQKVINGKKTDLFILKNKCGNEVALTNYGGALLTIMVPDKNGKHANVVQGHDCIDDVVNSPQPFLSTLIGRYGNRIAGGKFNLDGKEYTLAVNNGPNHLHGGPTGFHARVWDAEQTDAQTVVMNYLSVDGEEGFPGNLFCDRRGLCKIHRRKSCKVAIRRAVFKITNCQKFDDYNKISTRRN